MDRNRTSRLPRYATVKSLSARRAWIEIIHRGPHHIYLGSLSARRAWIEISGADAAPARRMEQSLSARRAWIEIEMSCRSLQDIWHVALRKESVDRNLQSNIMKLIPGVALRKESVDRNRLGQSPFLASRVALRKESVDRNPKCSMTECLNTAVALRKESVDRNAGGLLSCNSLLASLSARRAWIEIVPFRGHDFWPRVALRKESVDRNFTCWTSTTPSRGRSPQGERG